ncbi:MAG: hypothetical protein ACRDF6_00025 [bacterium]
MTSTQLFPLVSSLIILVFATLVLRRFAVRRSGHLLVWGIGLLMFGVAALAEAYSTVAWHPVAFRLWYLAGAALSAAWIGQGSVHLLAGTWGRSARRWNPPRLAAVLTGVLIAASLLAAYLVFSLPLNPAGFDAAAPLSAQYREILPANAGVRKLTPFLNIYGTVALVGGALYSAWLWSRKETMFHRVVGNVLIAAGAMLIASTSAMVRLGLADYLYLGQVLAAGLMFSGFLLASARASIPSPAAPAEA